MKCGNEMSLKIQVTPKHGPLDYIEPEVRVVRHFSGFLLLFFYCLVAKARVITAGVKLQGRFLGEMAYKELSQSRT
jgi:hypothetical protein